MSQKYNFKDIIKSSQNNCRKYKINVQRIFPTTTLEGKAFHDSLDRNSQLIKISRPFMETLYNFLKGSGFALYLTDKVGFVLFITGDDNIIKCMAEVGIVEGADMSEKSTGTNAIGTAIHEDLSVQISGEEHYITAYHTLTCSAAIIHNEEGTIIGCLNLTGKRQLAHPHTLGLVVAAVKSIESQLKVEKYQNMYNLANKRTGKNASYNFEDIIGNSEVIIKVIEQAKNIANSPSTVLIQGESGTGKELIAQSIHNNSSRKDNSFISINCGAITKGLIESELFGYEDGAFTGAKRGGQLGKFELANGGTIFLDEIGEMPFEMQVHLLTVLQTSCFNRVGGNKYINVDVRIIAATNKDLKTEVKNGNFREDLYYRLSVIPIFLPPLRMRVGDIEILIEYFLKAKAIKLDKPVPKISYDIYRTLVNYTWPGNVRELENCIENIVNMDGDTSFNFEDKSLEKKESPLSTETFQYDMYTLKQWENMAIINCIKKCGGNITKASKILGINRSTIYSKIKNHSS
ncbi:MAG: sigma-54-dependent Fis family transcriptional regulator [Clostridium sp.]|uniref:sigma-54-dependent Fis family transcriptional regulator n=1 Tax=Clostridium sp. TaxID=1506 RepID=UPI003D6CCDED